MAGISLTLLIVLCSLLSIVVHLSADEREFYKEGLTKGEKLGLVQNVVCQSKLTCSRSQSVASTSSNSPIDSLLARQPKLVARNLELTSALLLQIS